jgi:hypothetical protein
VWGQNSADAGGAISLRKPLQKFQGMGLSDCALDQSTLFRGSHIKAELREFVQADKEEQA